MNSRARPPSLDILRAKIQRGAGARVWDSRGKTYFDFHSAYATLNQGHCHPEIVRALQQQSATLTLSSNAVKHDLLESFAEKITSLFGYECVIPMNTGSEACETAIKYARRWGYDKKNVSPNEAIIVVPTGTYSGNSLAAVSSSSDPELRRGFGPFLPGFQSVTYGDLAELAEALRNPTVVALLLEPIQGESGVIIPPPGYLERAKKICTENNVLFIADEIQTGLGRTGALSACSEENVKPDLLLLGKALSGGMFPVSAVLCGLDVGNIVGAEEHNSTFAGSPLACSVALSSLNVVVNENLPARAFSLGNLFRQEVSSWNIPWIKEVRGKGLLNCLEITASSSVQVWILSRALEEVGVIAIPISKKILRLCPPLVISDSEMSEALEKIRSAFLLFGNGTGQ
ncbi:MAG: ornithine--oxo-acid transaminase [Bdellovibrionota bacterium]